MASSFMGNPKVEYLGGKIAQFRLLEDFEFWTENKELFKFELGKSRFSLSGDRKYFITPKMFVANGASVPRVFWTFLPPNGKYGKATFSHDYHYYCLRLFEENITNHRKLKKHEKKYLKEQRKLADQIFLEEMEVLGVNKFKRKVMYRALRMFGSYKL